MGVDSNPQIGIVTEYFFIFSFYSVVNVSFCDGPLSGVHCPCVRASKISSNNFS